MKIESNYKQYSFDESRIDKRNKLISMGVNPYPYSFPDVQKISDVMGMFQKLEAEQSPVLLCGRIWSKRDMGKTCFMDLRDASGKIQLFFAQKNIEASLWDQIALLDLGDILGVEGAVFRTKTREATVKVVKFTVLCKTVVPIPIGKEIEDKVYYRVADVESKYRERYLHWLLHEQDKSRIVKRSHIISAIRRRMEVNGFLEVSTPTIESVYGGATARPFKTSIWALDNKEAFLRISPELYLKRYIVAGFERVFAICQNFRNEGIDYSHNPEFTMLEWYEVFTDYEFQMNRFENLVADVCKEICGSTRIVYQGVPIDFSPPWRRMTILGGLKEYAGIDAARMTEGELLERHGLKDLQEAPLSWGAIVMKLFESLCEKHLVQPTFVLDYPIDVSPLTKVKRGDKRLVERFEPYVCNIEIGNAYSEMTDPIDQLERFIKQRGMQGKDQGYEDNPLDVDFIKAVGCGMPPTGGVGLGIDRLVMLLTDTPNIRDIIPFPMVKPRN